MATPPFVVHEGEDRALDVAVGDGRQRLALSDRADALVAALGYGNRDVVPWTVARALVLAGGATHPDRDARELAAELGGAAGGATASDADLRALADYLRSVTVPDPAVETLREHVGGTGLSRFLEPDELGSRADRVGDLSDVARDL